MRKQRKEDLEKHVSEVNALLRKSQGLPTDDEESSDSEASSSSDFEGFDDSAPAEIDREDEYIDEDKYTTVTIESVDISKDGFSKPGEKEVEDEESKRKREEAEAEAKKKRVWTKERPQGPKKKKKKFRYETKAERKAQRVKLGVKKKALAEKRKAA